MTIFERKKLERDKFRKLRDGISLNQRENVEKNVRLYVDSFSKGYKNIGYIAIYWPLKNEVDIRSLKKKFTLALPRCKDKKELKIAGVIGDPINHTRSPLIHQYWINKNQINCFYIPLRVKSFELEKKLFLTN